jgi:hypothetical protein
MIPAAAAASLMDFSRKHEREQAFCICYWHRFLMAFLDSPRLQIQEIQARETRGKNQPCELCCVTRPCSTVEFFEGPGLMRGC